MYGDQFEEDFDDDDGRNLLVNELQEHLKELTKQNEDLKQKNITSDEVIACVALPTCRMPTCRIPTCRIPTRRIPTCGMPTCRIPTCRIPTCRIPTCRIPTCRIPTCRIPTCRISTCRIPTRRIPTRRCIMRQYRAKEARLRELEEGIGNDTGEVKMLKEQLENTRLQIEALQSAAGETRGYEDVVGEKNQRIKVLEAKLEAIEKEREGTITKTDLIETL
ncbi:hypothetical protein GNI_148970 [Gregarina niphandrodes]|uniref:Uncharacterized protein n=1 Tax=Gregarina niphandrodes TaxID=110365 RepID=A0A023AZM3_GRENI|nr:hypothetical protein GNI_148970 [Gregarina niphandrodes]EZG44311.1 hypothetical protein GNI_148970 [Gregarina niphandrodes]|eukprot:XP_011132713.1 hypothetical protein GNI_148970 [Gregarina niphandrodes]